MKRAIFGIIITTISLVITSLGLLIVGTTLQDLIQPILLTFVGIALIIWGIKDKQKDKTQRID